MANNHNFRVKNGLEVGGTLSSGAITATSTSSFSKFQTTSQGSLTAPRWDTSMYVMQSQHWYGHSNSQDMLLGESGNNIRVRGEMNIGSNANADVGYKLTIRGDANTTGNFDAGTISSGAITSSGIITATGGNSGQWNTAYGWGNHASQSYATQSYVGTAISNLVDSSPATLDTLNELAAALGDDPNFATTVTNSIATKLPLAGGTMTGTLNIVTGDSSESIINLLGGSQGTGKLYVGQSTTHGGGIEYNGDGTPTSSGSGADYITLYRRTAGTDSWTARNFHNSNDWNFRGNLYANDTQRVFADNYHPNADKWTTARNHVVTLTGAVTGTATQSVDGTANETWTIATTATSDPTLTLAGDVTGSATFTNLGNATLTTTVANDSHTHSNYVLKAGDTMTGKLTLDDAGYSLGNEYHKWKRAYTVNTSSPQEILYSDGNSLPTGGVYRFTAHISSTGTDQFATAVYWNQNGTWRINVTGQSGISSNHPEFIIDATTNKPTIFINHTSSYGIHILGERIELDEGTGTDNAGYAFGTDAFLGSVNNNLYFLPGGTTTTGQGSYDDGNVVWHTGDLTTTNKSNYDTAYGWGNHASAGYLTAEADTLSTVLARGATSTQSITSLDTNGTSLAGLSIGEAFANYDGWNTQLNVHGGPHSRLNVKTSTVRMGVYAHNTWHNISGSTLNGHVGTYTNHGLGFLVNASPKMVINTSGQVGINQTSPTSQLHVGGIIAATGGNSTNWNTAYGWGNHASGGYYAASNPNGYTANTGTMVETGTTFSGTYNLTYRIGANSYYSHAGMSFTGSTNTLSVTGSITVGGTVDGVDIAARNGVLTTTTTTANAALPKAGGTMTGELLGQDFRPASGYHYRRSNHHSGHLEGSYNNVAANSLKSNPIYTIGSSYNPTDAALSDMYGIGYSRGDASFLTSLTGTSNWGMYVAADGDARVWLDASGGIVKSTGEHYVGSSRVFHDTYHPNADKWTTARTLTLSGDVTGSVSFDGSAAINMTNTVVANNSHTHNNLSNYYLATNPSGYTSNVGDITGVTAGTGMTGGGTSGAVTLNVIGGTGITANANDIAVDSTVLRTTGNQTKDAILNTRNSALDDETLFAITDSDDTASVRAKFYTTSTTITKVDDATAPASGVFKITGSLSLTWGEYIPMDDETEIMFECWIKHVSGTDTSGNFYAGGEFYNGSKTSYGNTQRYWGANGDAHDSDTPNPPRWRHIKGVMHGGAIRAQGSTPDAQYVRLLVLANYNAAGNSSHFCGFRFYRSKKTISSLWLRTHNTTSPNQDSAWQNLEASTAVNIIDNSGNINSPGNITVSGTVDGVDIATRNGVLTTTTNTANAALPKAGGTMTGNLVMNNTAITGVNNLTFADPGPNEGIAWTGGNTKIYESPDDLTTNTAGNLQFVYGTTRRLTVNNSGINVNGTVNVPTGDYTTATTRNNFATAHGYIQLGPMNTTWAHIYTDRANFYFNKNLHVLGDKVFHDTYHPNADTLTTARTIGGVSFNGSANINLPGVNTAGNQNTSGNAATVTQNHSDGGGNYPILWRSAGTTYYTDEVYITASTNKITATTFAGALSGNATTATTATNATNIYTTQTAGTAGIHYPTFVSVNSSGQKSLKYDPGMMYDPSTNILGDVNFNFKGTLTGNATTATNLTSGSKTITGDLTVSGNQVITAATAARVKFSVWSGTTYGIGMENGYTFGAINNNYVMSFQMNDEADRGFWWGDATHTNAQGAMALSTDGYLTVARGMRIGYGETDTTHPLAGIQAAGDIVITKSQPWLVIENTTEDGGGIVFNDNQAGAWPAASSQAFRITYNSGGTTNTLIMGHDENSYAGFSFATGGNFIASGNVTAYSDERLKTDIQTLDGKKVLQMRGVSFTKDGEAGSGVIAQELEKIAPELVRDGEYKSVAYGNLVGYLIENAKTQQKEIDELKSLVKQLIAN